jgi:hypothetical protein
MYCLLHFTCAHERRELRMVRSWSIVSLLLSGLLVAAGCNNEPKRYHVWGKATYQGQPIPAGSITFDPDIPAGGRGPQGFAIIKNGEYDTRNDGLGHVGGKYAARIYAADGIPQIELPIGGRLFPELTIPRELPLEDIEWNIDVPRQ